MARGHHDAHDQQPTPHRVEHADQQRTQHAHRSHDHASRSPARCEHGQSPDRDSRRPRADPSSARASPRSRPPSEHRSPQHPPRRADHALSPEREHVAQRAARRPARPSAVHPFDASASSVEQISRCQRDGDLGTRRRDLTRSEHSDRRLARSSTTLTLCQVTTSTITISLHLQQPRLRRIVERAIPRCPLRQQIRLRCSAHPRVPVTLVLSATSTILRRLSSPTSAHARSVRGTSLVGAHRHQIVTRSALRDQLAEQRRDRASRRTGMRQRCPAERERSLRTRQRRQR